MPQDATKITYLQKSIIETITFFDLFDYPLTPLEIWKYLGVRADQEEVFKVIDSLGLETGSGFYFLAGRSGIVKTRLDRYNYAHRKFRRVLRVTRFFAAIPWVRLVAVGNQIGAGNARNGSDIDFFIITAPRRIWLTRLLAAGAMKLLNLRPQPERKQDTVCLSFYVTTQALDLQCARLDDRDIYFRYWLATLVPVFDRGEYYKKLLQANTWLGRELPNWQPMANVWPHRLDAFDPLALKIIGNMLGWLEAPARALEKAVLPADLKENMNQNSNCLINDNMLKLFVNDRREEWRRKYWERLG